MRVLFLCRGNSARSQMAEAFGAHYSEGKVEFHSAGTWPSRFVDPTAVLVLREKGIDISKSIPKNFNAVPKPLDWIIAVCEQAEVECPQVPGVNVERWLIKDPALVEESVVERLDIFREVRDEIEREVLSLLRRCQIQ